MCWARPVRDGMALAIGFVATLVAMSFALPLFGGLLIVVRLSGRRVIRGSAPARSWR